MEPNPAGNCPPPSPLGDPFLQFLRLPEHAAVQDALIYLERRTGRLQVQGLAQLRDALDHLTRAAAVGTSDEDVNSHLVQARDHLRRAVVPALQDYADDLSAQVERRAKGYSLRKEFFPDLPSERDFRKSYIAILEKLSNARPLKGTQSATIEAIGRLMLCCDELGELLIDIKPSRSSLFLRLAKGTFLMLLAGGVGAAITKLWFG